MQGAELMVLQTIDWSMLSVGVLLSECLGIGCTGAQDVQVEAAPAPDPI